MSKKKHRKCANFYVTGCRNTVTSKKRTVVCRPCQLTAEAERLESPEEEAERIRLANEHAKAIGLDFEQGGDTGGSSDAGQESDSPGGDPE